jgi:hypothetical protein
MLKIVNTKTDTFNGEGLTLGQMFIRKDDVYDSSPPIYMICCGCIGGESPPYFLMNLKTGTAYCVGEGDIREVFGNYAHLFTPLKAATITI